MRNRELIGMQSAAAMYRDERPFPNLGASLTGRLNYQSDLMRRPCRADEVIE